MSTLKGVTNQSTRLCLTGLVDKIDKALNYKRCNAYIVNQEIIFMNPTFSNNLGNYTQSPLTVKTEEASFSQVDVASVPQQGPVITSSQASNPIMSAQPHPMKPHPMSMESILNPLPSDQSQAYTIDDLIMPSNYGSMTSADKNVARSHALNAAQALNMSPPSWTATEPPPIKLENGVEAPQNVLANIKAEKIDPEIKLETAAIKAEPTEIKPEFAQIKTEFMDI